MSAYYTSELLIESVKRRINIPANQNTFTDEDILAFADEELGLSVVPAIMSLHEDYLLFVEDQDLVENQNDYIIPYRAVGNKLYDLQYVDQDGNVYLMSRATAADEPFYQGSYTVNRTYAYYIKNNRISLMPRITGDTQGTLRFIYYIRPSQLVMTEDVGVVTDINTDTGDVTVSSLPSTFSTNTPLDFYKAQSPHNVLKIDKTPTSVNSTSKTITFDTEDIPSDLAVGDQIALSQQCAIPQIPSDLHVYLAQKTAERILEAQGDSEGLALAKQKSAEMQNSASLMIDNRVDESPIKLSNRTGILKTGLFSYNRRRRR